MPARRMSESELARPRARKGKQPEVTLGESVPCKQPRASSEWDAGVKRLWKSMGQSGQAGFYQASDWEFARVALDELNRLRSDSRPSAEALKGVFTALGQLMLTETDRRKARIELTQPADESRSAAVLAIAEYKEALGVPS